MHVIDIAVFVVIYAIRGLFFPIFIYTLFARIFPNIFFDVFVIDINPRINNSDNNIFAAFSYFPGASRIRFF